MVLNEFEMDTVGVPIDLLWDNAKQGTNFGRLDITSVFPDLLSFAIFAPKRVPRGIPG